MEQGGLTQSQGVINTSVNSNSKIDVNTDTLQKLVLSVQEETVEHVKGTDDTKQKESSSPLQHILKGNEKEAKQELLKDFIHKVAGSERDIMFGADKGKKDVELMKELNLLFGKDSLKKDEVVISSQSKMMQMTDAIVQSQAVAALRKEMSQEEDSKKADKLEKLEKQIFEEKSGIREKLVMDKPDKTKANEENQRNIENFDKNKYSQEGQDQDNSGKNKQSQQEMIDDDDTLAISKLKQKAREEIEELTEDEDTVDEIEEVELKDAQQKGAKVNQPTSIKSEPFEIEKGNSEDIAKKDSIESIEAKEPRASKDDMVTKYTDHYKKYLMLPNKDLDGLIKNEEELLKEFGLTTRQIKDVQQAVKKTIKQEIRGKIEDAIIQKQLSIGNKLDSLITDTRLNKFTDYFVSNLLLGGQDFGGFDDNFQGLVNKAMYFASKHLANFSIEEMESFVSCESIGPPKTKVEKIRDFEAKVNELNSITNNPKITEEWAQIAMEAFMKDYGLAREKLNIPIQPFGNGVNVMTGETGTGQSNQHHQKNGYEFDSKDEKDVFLNRLRALYLQRALNPGISTSLKTEFKIRKLKNGLMRMGVFTEILNERVQKEAEEVAKDRTMDMLKEALEERASLFDLKGTTYDLLESKIKGIFKNAEKLGLEITTEQFNKMRDEINYRMFEITKKQMELLEVRISDADFPQLVVKYREMQKLIDRLKQESGIQDDDIGNEKFHNVTIAESA